jgi:diguanylate cyclase (GGDEF)-like protein
VVDDEPYLLPTLEALLSGEFEVVTAGSPSDAQELLNSRRIDIILTDQRMPQMTGVQLLQWVRQHNPHTIGLLMTGYAELEDAVEAINRGHVYYYLLKPWRTEELFRILRNAAERVLLKRNHDQLMEELRRVNAQLEERVQDRTRELQESNQRLQQRNHELERLALTDPLTGLLNRRAIEEVARSELNRHSRYPNSRLAVGIVDADNFREINRRYLHSGGDQVLISLANTLTGSMRTVDAVGRIGGEEFLVVAPETGIEGAHTLSERIRSAVENAAIHHNGERINLTISGGFVVAEHLVPTTYLDMKLRAEKCLREAKDAGRNCCVVCSVLDPVSLSARMGAP